MYRISKIPYIWLVTLMGSISWVIVINFFFCCPNRDTRFDNIPTSPIAFIFWPTMCVLAVSELRKVRRLRREFQSESPSIHEGDGDESV